MDHPTAATSKGERTREHLIETALGLFRRDGFDATSMREIAREAGLSLGAAYHYFASKEALVAAYYERVQAAHAAAVAKALRGLPTVRERVEAVLVTILDLIEDDRQFLSALFRFAGEPGHPLSVFSEETRAIREQAIATHAAAFDGMPMPERLRAPAAQALWALHLGLLLHALHDPTRRLSRTRGLAHLAAGMIEQGLELMSLPLIGDRVLDVVQQITSALHAGAPQKASRARSGK